jgi:predicted nucleic acid-binding protein
MRKVFIDANIIITVLNREYPLFRMCSRILSLADHRDYELYTSPTCLAISFYFASKKCGESGAREKIRMLSEKIKVTKTGQEEVIAALGNPKINDFEDGIAYYSALNAQCGFIITEDRDDFYFSEIPIMTCEAFLREVALPSLAKPKKQGYK